MQCQCLAPFLKYVVDSGGRSSTSASAQTRCAIDVLMAGARALGQPRLPSTIAKTIMTKKDKLFNDVIHCVEQNLSELY